MTIAVVVGKPNPAGRTLAATHLACELTGVEPGPRRGPGHDRQCHPCLSDGTVAGWSSRSVRLNSSFASQTNKPAIAG